MSKIRITDNEKIKAIESYIPQVLDKELETRGLRFTRQKNGIAEMLNSMIRGWMDYFGRFNSSAMKYTLQCIECRLVKWAMCKYKSFRGHRQKAEKWLSFIRKREPKRFAH